MTIHPQASIGHVHLTVSDLERSLGFYRDLLGFSISARYGDSAVFLSAGGYHHHIGLNTWAGPGIPPSAANQAGLYHAAILFPTRRALAEAVKALIDAEYPLEGMADHGVSEAVYLRDPDNIGLELYTDRPKEAWKVSNDGLVEMVTKPLGLENLLAELDSAPPRN